MDLQEQLKLIEEMKERRFFHRGEEDIEVFENNLNKIKEGATIEIIPDLCSLMNDEAIFCSPMELVIKVIQSIVLNAKEEKEIAILKLFEGTKKMKNNAYDWALVLHTQFLINPKLLQIYIDAFKLLNSDSDKKFLIELLQDIYDEEYFEEPDLQVIIRELED